MKSLRTILSIVLLATVLIFDGCKKEEVSMVPLTLVTLKTGTIDLNKRNPDVVNVPVDLNIIATFSTDIDFNTVNKYNITIKHDTTHVLLSYIVSGNTIAIVPVTPLLLGAIDTLTISSQVKSTGGQAFEGASFVFTTTGIGIDTPPQSAAQVLYLQFNGTVGDLTGNAVVASTKLTYVTDRFGIATRAAYFRGASAGGTGDIVELTGTQFINPSMTLSVWINIANTYYKSGKTAVLGLSADNGYYFELAGDSVLGPDAITFTTDHEVDSGVYHSVVNRFTGADAVNDTVPVYYHQPVASVISDGWHHFVITYDETTALKTFYMDGKIIEQWLLRGPDNKINVNGIALNLNAPPLLDPKLAIGYYCSKINTASLWADYSTARNTFIGALDDLRLFNLALTTDEVVALYNLEQAPK